MSKTKKDSKDSKAMRKYTPHKPKMTPYKESLKHRDFVRIASYRQLLVLKSIILKLLRYGGHSPKAC